MVKNLRDYVNFDGGGKLIKVIIFISCEAHTQKPAQYREFHGLKKEKLILASEGKFALTVVSSQLIKATSPDVPQL